MNLKKVLSTDTVVLELKSATKEAVIEEMVDLLVSAGKIRSEGAREEALKAVLERERKMSTGMQNGIAIPHGKTDAVDSLVAALAVKREGIDFGSLDGRPATIFIMTISPDNRTGPHIQFLAEISRHLNDAQVREQILHADSKQAILDVLTS